ncbi:zinc finger BED domain-containing protein RICESLEEPER 1-like [Nicotiana sylvestris]|uniref:zinc finger BED domain-containing protein RICESLEEPER 1-like n=1 Tax=Nicotiana sylvestris TaxID=4096 RepID=UPI00388CEA50
MVRTCATRDDQAPTPPTAVVRCRGRGRGRGCGCGAARAPARAAAEVPPSVPAGVQAPGTPTTTTTPALQETLAQFMSMYTTLAQTGLLPFAAATSQAGGGAQTLPPALLSSECMLSSLHATPQAAPSCSSLPLSLLCVPATALVTGKTLRIDEILKKDTRMEDEVEMVNKVQALVKCGESGASNDSTSNVESDSGSKKRKIMKERSVAWRHFKEYVANTKNSGTSNLLSHLLKCPNNPHKPETSQTKLAFQPKGQTGDVSLIPWKFDQEACRRALARMIIIDEQPFISVEKDGFRDFVRALQPLFHIPSRTTMTRDCFEIYHDEKLALKSIFKESKQRICITTDTWTSIQRINYMCVTAHYIDKNWNLHKKILNFCPITSHKGQDLASGVAKCLLEWGVDKVFTVTVDNASSNDVMVKELSKQFTRWNTNLMEGKHVHVRCMAHIINLVVQDGLREGSVSVERIRQAVRYIRQSPARWKKFKECCDLDRITSKKSLCLDVPTRWNSTYLMLKVATVYEEAFTKYCDIDYGLMSCISNCICEDGQPAGPLLSTDWDSVRRIVKFLEIFYELTLKVSGTLYITSNVHFLEICVVGSSLKELMQSEDATLKEMANNMKEKFDKYWGDPQKMNKMIFISCVFDPRHKFQSLSFALAAMFGETIGVKIQIEVKTYMESLFNVYAKKNGGSGSFPYSPSSGSCPSSPSSPGSCPSSPTSSTSSSSLSKFMLDLKKHKKGEGIDSKTELDKYLGEDVEEDFENFKILGWWKLNSPRFPALAEMEFIDT